MEKLAGFLLLPELKFNAFTGDGVFVCEKTSEFEVCPRCACPSWTAGEKLELKRLRI
jgi:hypothetical protein